MTDVIPAAGADPDSRVALLKKRLAVAETAGQDDEAEQIRNELTKVRDQEPAQRRAESADVKPDTPPEGRGTRQSRHVTTAKRG